MRFERDLLGFRGRTPVRENQMKEDVEIKWKVGLCVVCKDYNVSFSWGGGHVRKPPDARFNAQGLGFGGCKVNV